MEKATNGTSVDITVLKTQEMERTKTYINFERLTQKHTQCVDEILHRALFGILSVLSSNEDPEVT